MAVGDILFRANVLRAKLGAKLGAVEHPQAAYFKALGIKLRPGMKALDSVTGELVEVVDAGVRNVSVHGLL